MTENQPLAQEKFTDDRPLLRRMLVPYAPRWIAIPCTILAAAALGALIVDPVANVWFGAALAGAAGVSLYGTKAVLWWRGRNQSVADTGNFESEP